MAYGDFVFFEEFADQIAKGLHDFNADAFKMALVSDTTVLATQTTPALGDFTEVTGGTSYVAGGQALTLNYSYASGVATLDFTTNPLWSQDASGPTDIRWGIVYNTTSGHAVGFTDQRPGGSPASLQTGDVGYTFNASGMGTVTVT